MRRLLHFSFTTALFLCLSSSANLWQMHEDNAKQALVRLVLCSRTASCRALVYLSEKRTCTQRAIVAEINPPLRQLAEAAMSAELRRRHPSSELLATYSLIIDDYGILLTRGMKKIGPKPNCDNKSWQGSRVTTA